MSENLEEFISQPAIMYEDQKLISLIKEPRVAVFIDRDGTINSHVKSCYSEFDSPYSLQELKVFSPVKHVLKEIVRKKYIPIIISNQPGIAKKRCTLNILREINQLIVKECKSDNSGIASIIYCLHHPQSQIYSLKQKCECRKPETGMFSYASKRYNIDLENSYYIGDRPSDLKTALKSKCKFIRINTSDCWEKLGGDSNYQSYKWEDIPYLIK